MRAFTCTLTKAEMSHWIPHWKTQGVKNPGCTHHSPDSLGFSEQSMWKPVTQNHKKGTAAAGVQSINKGENTYLNDNVNKRESWPKPSAASLPVWGCWRHHQYALACYFCITTENHPSTTINTSDLRDLALKLPLTELMFLWRLTTLPPMFSNQRSTFECILQRAFILDDLQ